MSRVRHRIRGADDGRDIAVRAVEGRVPLHARRVDQARWDPWRRRQPAVQPSDDGRTVGGADNAVLRVGRGAGVAGGPTRPRARSEEHTSELQSLMRLSYAV